MAIDKSNSGQKILMLHGSSDLYGASKIFVAAVTALQNSGFGVLVVLSEDGPLVDELQKMHAEVFIQKLGILRRKYFNPAGLVNRIKTIWRAKNFLEGLIKNHQISHIYSNTSAVLVGAFLSRKGGIKHIWHLHEILSNPKWLKKAIGKIIDRNADKVVVVSQAVWDNWENVIAPSKMKLLYNGIDYQPYLEVKTDIKNEMPGSEGKVLIGMIGRINHWKGQGYFLDIAELLVQKSKNVHFLMVGDAFPGSEHLVKEMLGKIKKMGLENQVTYLGFRKDIPQILKSLDVFVLPSILPDPFPTVILEAMASEKPVVATDHGGAQEMIQEGQTGFLIPWNNAAKGADAVSILVQNEKLRNKMGLNGRKRVLEKFSPKEFEAKFISLFEHGKA